MYIMKQKVLMLFVILFFNSFAQNSNDVEFIKKHSNDLLIAKIRKGFLEKEKLIQEYKIKNNFSNYLIDAKGRMSYLIDFDDFGRPIYVSEFNNGATLTTRARKLWNGGGLGLNVQGQGMTVGIWEVGSTRITHSHFQGRAIQSDNSTAALSDHANHTLGTMIQYKSSAPVSRGMAFNANANCYDVSNSYLEILDAANNGLLVSNHSYGYYFNNPSSGSANIQASQAGKYNATSVDVDTMLNAYPYYISVWAAGNERDSSGSITNKGGYDMLNSYTCAKNNIVVGAVNAVPIYSTPSDVVMSSFSCWGPTDDGRIKPDLVAKGVSVVSCMASSDTATGSMDGTSMASPGVAGTLILLQQHYKNVNNQFMKAATLKGLALHSADEAGLYDGPDYSFGWGLINAEEAATIISDSSNNRIIETTLSNGETKSYIVNVSNTLLTFAASICWNDPAGLVNNGVEDNTVAALVNDLDIRVTNLSNNAIYYPWMLNVASPSLAAVTGDNLVDPFEKIEIKNPGTTYKIDVVHKGILKDQLPQDFSLVLSNVNSVNLSNDINSQLDKTIFVYPNPTTGVLNVKSELIDLDRVYINDITGKTILDSKLGFENTISLSPFQTGIYFVNFVTSDNRIITKKVFKE